METKQLTTPVLLIVFNRPDYTTQTFEAIRQARPHKLYVASDAPRPGNENDKINNEKVKDIVKQVDWDCEVNYRFSETNLGCGYGPYSAISWVFEHEDRAIILEDDCVGVPAFFEYCDHLLEKYKNDTRVWLLSGRSHQCDSKYFDDKDYLFSHFGHTWGWATWRRCWEKMDMDFKDIDKFLEMGGAKNTLVSKKQGEFYNKLLRRVSKDKKLNSHAWDLQWLYAGVSSSALCVVPAKNLIKNVGVDGTHSVSANKYIDLQSDATYKIEKEPSFVMVERGYEELHFRTHIKKIFPPLYIRAFRKIIREIKKRLCKK